MLSVAIIYKLQNIFDTLKDDFYRFNFLSDFRIKSLFYRLIYKTVLKRKKASANKLAAQLFIYAIRMQFFIESLNRINNFNFIIYPAKA